MDCCDPMHVAGSEANGKMHVNGGWNEPFHMSPEGQSNHLPTFANHSEQDKMEPIAIIGLSLRFPQDAISPQTFWKMLMEKRSAMTEVPSDRFDVQGFYEAGEHRTGMVR